MPRVMRPLRALIRSLLFAAASVVMLAAPAHAQSPSPSPGGLCAPWHRCVAGGLMLAMIGFVALAGLGFLLQRRGFDKVQHRQGSPDGVPVNKA